MGVSIDEHGVKATASVSVQAAPVAHPVPVHKPAYTPVHNGRHPSYTKNMHPVEAEEAKATTSVFDFGL